MKYIGPKEFREYGLLFEINRRVLHPLGLAMAVEIDDDGNVAFSNKIWDCRDDPEGIIYDEETFEEAQERFLTFMKEQGNDLIKCRKEQLGYFVQTKGEY